MTTTFTISQSPSGKNLYLYPNASQSTALTASGDTENYECVDEAYNAPDTTTYVYSTSTTAVQDIYGMQDSSGTSGTINYIQVYGRAKSETYPQSSTGTYDLLISVKDTSTSFYTNYKNSETTYGSDINLATSYITNNCVWTSNPSSQATWSWNDINNLRIGLECSSPSISHEAHMYLYPNDDDTSEAIELWNPSGGIEENWEQLIGESGYVRNDTGDSAVYKWDWYKMDDYDTSEPTGSITSITLWVKIKDRYAQQNNKCARYIYYGAQNHEYIDTTRHKTWRWYSNEALTNPSGGQSWKWTEINTLRTRLGFYMAAGNTDWTYCQQLFLDIKHNPTNLNPEIRTTQCYCKVNYTPTSTSVTLNQPQNIAISHGRNVTTGNTWVNDRIVRDDGRSHKTITIQGIEHISADATMNNLSDFADNPDEVTIAGLDDTSLNRDYRIKNFNFTEEGGHDDRFYRYTLVLEEV